MVGYSGVPTSDPKEQKLREEWYRAKGAKENGDEGAVLRFEKTNEALSAYVWKRGCKLVEEDRVKHPKAKRNQKYDGPKGEGRAGL